MHDLSRARGALAGVSARGRAGAPAADALADDEADDDTDTGDGNGSAACVKCAAPVSESRYARKMRFASK